jgi:hypothetical protein
MAGDRVGESPGDFRADYRPLSNLERANTIQTLFRRGKQCSLMAAGVGSEMEVSVAIRRPFASSRLKYPPRGDS